MRVFVVGDSISLGYGPMLAAAIRPWASYARKEDDGSELGANGGDSQAVLAYLRASRDWRDADVLLVNCGLHDIKVDPATGRRQVPIDRYETTLLSIVDEVRRAGPALVWVRTTPVDDERHNAGEVAFHRYAADVRAYDARARRVMREAGVRTVDLFGFTRALGPDLYVDHVHFTRRVEDLQAAFVAGWLQAAFGDGRDALAPDGTRARSAP